MMKAKDSKNNRVFCWAVDLKDQPGLITQYMEYHKQGNVWPEVVEHIKKSGIVNMRIYSVGDRVIMVMEVNEEFSLGQPIDTKLPDKVKEWDNLMAKFQSPLKWAEQGETWTLMNEIFAL